MHIFGLHVLVATALLVAVLTTLFAVWKGDTAVRLAAGTHAAVEVLTLIVNPQLGDVGAESWLLAVDFASSVIFLLLAIRFANLWIGGAMLLQAAQFALHAYYLVMELPHDKLHAWVNNTCDWGIMMCLVVGTALAIRRRVRWAREAAELEARRQQRTSPTP